MMRKMKMSGSHYTGQLKNYKIQTILKVNNSLNALISTLLILFHYHLETRFDVIILPLSFLFRHMPDLSAGRGTQLALLTINQPDGGGGCGCGGVETGRC